MVHTGRGMGVVYRPWCRVCSPGASLGLRMWGGEAEPLKGAWQTLPRPRKNSTNLHPLSVWPHLFRGAGHEKRRGEQLKWSLAFRLYTGSFPRAQLPGPVHTARFGRVFFCVFSLGLYFVFICAFWFVCMSPFFCFPEQLSHIPDSFCC